MAKCGGGFAVGQRRLGPGRSPSAAVAQIKNRSTGRDE